MESIDFTKLLHPDEISGENEEDTLELRRLFFQAREHISNFYWCGGIEESYFGAGVAGVVLVALFKVETFAVGVYEWNWVIVGDLPPACFAANFEPNPVSAIRRYLREMRKWVNAVNAGTPTGDLFPVNAPTTKKYAKMLNYRLEALEKYAIALASL